MRAAADKLNRLAREKKEHGDVEHLFRVLWRFKRHKPGQPSYPEVNESTVHKLLFELDGDLYEEYRKS